MPERGPAPALRGVASRPLPSIAAGGWISARVAPSLALGVMMLWVGLLLVQVASAGSLGMMASLR